MTADFNCQRNLLQCIYLIKMAWEKLKVCLRSNIWEKGAFRSSFNLIDTLSS